MPKNTVRSYTSSPQPCFKMALSLQHNPLVVAYFLESRIMTNRDGVLSDFLNHQFSMLKSFLGKFHAFFISKIRCMQLFFLFFVTAFFTELRHLCAEKSVQRNTMPYTHNCLVYRFLLESKALVGNPERSLA